VDVQEVRKLDAYLKRLFGNAKIRVVPRPKVADSAEVYIDDDQIGVLSVDDEDGDRSFQFVMAVREQDRTSKHAMDVQEVGKLDAHLKRVFGTPKIRVVPRPKKDDSAEVYIGQDFVGVLFVDDEDDDRSFQFQMAILEDDLIEQG